MIVAFDSSMLLLYLDPECSAPSEPDAEGKHQPVPDAHDRVAYLVEQLESKKASIIVPTPVLSEVLSGAGAARDSWLDQLQRSARFRIAPFCTLSAIELAEIERQARQKGGKKGPTPDSAYQKVKFDRQIVAIARVNQAEAIYGNDGDMRAHAELAGIPYYRCNDLAKRPQDSQTELQLTAPDPEDEAIEMESESSDLEDPSDDSVDPEANDDSRERPPPPDQPPAES